MRRADFEAMVRDMLRELPAGFLDGIDGVEVTGKTVPHPVRQGVFTLGECIPRDYGGDEGPSLRSSVELHFGSFSALAGQHGDFDWRHEAWETLTHEIRHHLEWRARVPALEKLDDAAEANFARHDGEAFPPLFYLDGEAVAPGVTRVEDDVFLDVELSSREMNAAAGRRRSFTWHGRTWSVTLPDKLPGVLFLTITDLDPEPVGEVVLVVRRKAGLRELVVEPRVLEIKVKGESGESGERGE